MDVNKTISEKVGQSTIKFIFKVTTVRQSSVFARVNRIVFSEQRNKFGVSDGDGNVSLWQANNTAQPYLNLEMFTKNCADLVFQVGFILDFT